MDINTREEITDNNGYLLPAYQQCKICYDNFEEPNKVICCPEHKHILCTGCYRDYISIQIPEIFRYQNIFSPLNDPENNHYDDNLNINTIPFHLKCICRLENQECSHNYNINTDEQFINFISEGTYNLDNVNLNFVLEDIQNNGNFIQEDQQTKNEIRDIIIMVNELKMILNQEIVNNQIIQITNQQDLRRTFIRLQEQRTLRCPYDNCDAICHDFVNGCAAIKCNGCNGDYCHVCHERFPSRELTENHIRARHGDLFNPPGRILCRNYLKYQNIIREMTQILEEIQNNINNAPDNEFNDIEPPINNMNLIENGEDINNNINNNVNEPPIIILNAPNQNNDLRLILTTCTFYVLMGLLADADRNRLYIIIGILQKEIKENGLEWVKDHLKDIIEKYNLSVSIDILKDILDKCIENGIISIEVIKNVTNNIIGLKSEHIKQKVIDTAVKKIKKTHGLKDGLKKVYKKAIKEIKNFHLNNIDNNNSINMIRGNNHMIRGNNHMIRGNNHMIRGNNHPINMISNNNHRINIISNNNHPLNMISNNNHPLNMIMADNGDDVTIELTKQIKKQVYDNTDDATQGLVNKSSYFDSIKNSELLQKIKEIKNKKGSDFLDKLFKNPKFLNSFTVLSNTCLSFFITYCMSSDEEVCDSCNMFIEFLKGLSISLFYIIPGVNIGFWSGLLITFISSCGLNLLKNKKTKRISLKENLKRNMEMIEDRNNLEQNIENINNIIEEEINNDEEFRNIVDQQNREYEEALQEDQRREREEREREEQEQQWQEQVELDRIQREEDEERYRPNREEIARLYERRNPNNNNFDYIEI